MPRIRSIHPDICDDDTLTAVSAYAERTWLRLWTHLDDKGRGPDNAKLLKAKLYPLHDDVTSDRVERDLTELAACGLLIRYEVGGRRYLSCKPETWAKYQRPQKPTPTKLPAPPVEVVYLDATGTAQVAHGGVGSGDGNGVEKEGESEGESRPQARCGKAGGWQDRAAALASTAPREGSTTANEAESA